MWAEANSLGETERRVKGLRPATFHAVGPGPLARATEGGGLNSSKQAGVENILRIQQRRAFVMPAILR